MVVDERHNTCHTRREFLSRRVLSYLLIALTVGAVLRQGTRLTAIREAQQADETRFALAMEGASVGFWFWTLEQPPQGDDWTKLAAYNLSDHVWYSKLFVENLGYTQAEWPPVLATFLQHLHPDDLPTVLASAGSYFASGGMAGYEVSYRLRNKSGKWQWFLSRGSGAFIGGRPQTFAGSALPIDGIRSAKLRMARLIDSTPVAMIMCDSSQRITAFNPAAEELLGWTAAEVVGQTVDKIVGSECNTLHGEQFAKAVARLEAAGQPWEITKRHVAGKAVHKSGREFDCEITLRGIQYDGVVEFIAVLRDPAAPAAKSGPVKMGRP